MAVLRVKDAFAVTLDGATHVFPAGRLVDDSHPVVKGREALFEPAEVAANRQSGVVETATAEPGERRSLDLPPVPPANDDQPPASDDDQPPAPRAKKAAARKAD